MPKESIEHARSRFEAGPRAGEPPRDRHTPGGRTAARSAAGDEADLSVGPDGAGAADRAAAEPGEPEHRRYPSRGISPEQSRAFAVALAGVLDEQRCQHIVVLDVRELSPVSDYLIVGSGSSVRQMATALDKACEHADTIGQPAVRVNRDDGSTWLLADFTDVVVHLFEPNTRAHYDLEMLWGDAGRVDWRAGGPGPRPGSGSAGADRRDGSGAGPGAGGGSA